MKYNNLFNYMDSKITMLPHLIKDDRLKKDGTVLVEPFLGSCSLLLNTNYDKYYFNEYNVYIYDFIYSLLTIDLNELEKNYNILAEKLLYNGEDLNIKQSKKDFYYNCRDNYFKHYDKLTVMQKTSLYIFLIQNNFGGKPINTSISVGHIDRKKPFRKEIYKAFQAKKDKIVIANLDYREFISEVLKHEKQEDITLYLDPPYVDSFKYLKDNNVDNFVTDILTYYKDYNFKHTIMSNFFNDFILDTYKDYRIDKIERMLNVQTKDNKTKTELIIIKEKKEYYDNKITIEQVNEQLANLF